MDATPSRPSRPGERCGAEPGAYLPQVDHGRCEAKAACVQVCPYEVFEVGPIAPADYRDLSLFARMKVAFHGMRTAYTPRAELCRACGLCVNACPEGAIRLVPTTRSP